MYSSLIAASEQASRSPTMSRIQRTRSGAARHRRDGKARPGHDRDGQDISLPC
ncbi:hypothetical protein BZL30_9519 [Mycobacterium kansasii]|uniref:Uncharacterized protein n=1 Tax=Mycobacterium kansasii TaxID=1768 RepID=A0A1V3WAJ7_MYCKA|nr:hypothetical protein BZL30_9519 [Mycobacterium kansasii]